MSLISQSGPLNLSIDELVLDSGGTILSQLLEFKANSKVPACEITALVQGKDKAEILEGKGIKSRLFDSLDHTEQLQELASGYDVIVHTALGYHPPSAKALIQGLGLRKRSTGLDVHYIHTSGTSNLADQPITGAHHESLTFSDLDPDIYAYERMRNSKRPYPQRDTDLAVIEIGLKNGVKTYIIMSPTICGRGSGYFNRNTIQIPAMIRAAVKSKWTEVIGEGRGVFGHVHAEDLAKLYEMLVMKVLAEEELVSGERGIYFSDTGHHSWHELAERLRDAFCKLAVVGTQQIENIGLEEAAGKWVGGDTLLAEVGFAGSARTKSELSRNLGWEPKKTEEDFKQHFQSEVEAV